MSGAATQLGMPNLCILRAYLLSGVYFKHRWYESCRWRCWKGRKKHSKQRDGGQEGWGDAEEDWDWPNLQLATLAMPFLPLAYSHQSSNPVSGARKIEKSGSRIPSFSPFVFFFHCQSPPRLTSTFFFFSIRRTSSIEEKKLHHLSCWKRRRCNSTQPFMHAL